jgi:hypothetical protein
MPLRCTLSLAAGYLAFGSGLVEKVDGPHEASAVTAFIIVRHNMTVQPIPLWRFPQLALLDEGASKD